MAKASLKYQLINPVKIKTYSAELDFISAQGLADKKVESLSSASILISWYNATTGESYPDVKSRCAGKPGWLSHAELCNCDMTVDINDEQFVFIYQTQP